MTISWANLRHAFVSQPVITASVISVIGIVLNIIITTVYSENVKTKNQIIIEQEKGSITNNVNNQLETFKQDFERTKITNEHKYQIAQEAYRNFFTAKMNAYIQLANLKQEYEVSQQEFTPDNPIFVFNGASTDNLKLTNETLPKIMIKIQNHILANKIYFSNELVEAFDDWYKKTANKRAITEKILSEYNKKPIKPTKKNIKGSVINLNKVFKVENVFNEAEEERIKLFTQIDKDIIAIKSQYGL